MDDDVAGDFVANIETAPPVTSQEAEHLKAAKTRFAVCTQNSKRVPPPMPVGGDVSYFSMKEKGDPIVWNSVTAMVAEGTERLLAWFVDFNSNDRMDQNEKSNRDMPRRSVDIPSHSHSKFISGLAYFPTGVNHRLVENVLVW